MEALLSVEVFQKKNFEKIIASIGERLKKKYERTKNERKITRERLRKNERENVKSFKFMHSL